MELILTLMRKNGDRFQSLDFGKIPIDERTFFSALGEIGLVCKYSGKAPLE